MENRIIKFKGRRKLNGDWVYGSLLKSDSEDWDYILDIPYDEDNQPDRVRVISKTIGQFTGLKDKNGVDIYEGDIVEIIQAQIRNYVILWGTWSYVKRSSIEGFSFAFDSIEARGSTIIGNIHEHPHLLSPSESK